MGCCLPTPRHPRGRCRDYGGGARHPNLPATTVTGDPRLTSRDHHEPGGQARRSTRLTLVEAALLQTFPADFPFQGGSGKQFLQVGNAAPPRLAEALLAHLAATVPNPRA